jgi:Family of unknown function (DUF5677)
MPSKKKRRSSNRKADFSHLKHFEGLATYMARISKGTIHRHKMYSLCVRASVSKCFEFNLAAQDFAKSKTAFFAMSSLRGMCEDLIVLRYIGKMPPKDRERLVIALSSQELATRTKLQDIFFSAIRPQQPVLRLTNADNAIAASEVAARTIWNKHGWPNLQRGAMPPIRQIAEKQGLHQLAILYDYFYRLTSAGVHFNVQALLRSGWGSPKQFVFSAKNFHSYFERYCSVYGAFIFCLYFEFFGAILRPTAKERAIVDEIRQSVLFTPRWPEMVTFEEMNQKPPTQGETIRMILSALQAASRKRLISKGVNYNNKRSAERRLVSHLFKVLFQPDHARGDSPAVQQQKTVGQISRA